MTRCFLCNQCKISQKSFDIIISSLLNRVLGVFACSRALRAYVLACLHAYVLACLACLRACVLLCLHAYVLTCLVCLRACMLLIMKCFIFLRVCVLGVYTLGVLFCLISFTVWYLNLKIPAAKNLCALLSWTYFLFIKL